MTDDGRAGEPENRWGGDRRGSDRRRVERRRPPPPWRRWWAFASYGAVAAIVIVLLLVRGCGGGSQPQQAAADSTGSGIRPASAPVDTTRATRPAPAGPVENATTTGDFDRLTLEGATARGRMVRAQLYCDAPAAVATMPSDTMEADVAPLVDPQTRRVPGARCKWGGADDPKRSDFLLLVPPQLASAFASQPVVLDGTVRRRRVIANVEWLGQSRALALETVGIFRGNAQ